MRGRVAAAAILLLVGGCATGPRPQPDRRLSPRGARPCRLWRRGRLAGASRSRPASDGFSGGLLWRQRGDERGDSLHGPMGAEADCASMLMATLQCRHRDGQNYTARTRSVFSRNNRPGPAAADQEMRYWLVGMPEPASRTRKRWAWTSDLRASPSRAGLVRYDRYEPAGVRALPAANRDDDAGTATARRGHGLATAAMSDDAWPAPAKLNLFLHVTGRRPDGYHEIQTVFQLSIFPTASISRRAQTARSGARRAAAEVPVRTTCAFGGAAAAGGQPPGPGRRHPARQAHSGAGGLGGGSSDAATTLVALNEIWGLRLAPSLLAELGLELGADIPFLSWARPPGARVSGAPDAPGTARKALCRRLSRGRDPHRPTCFRLLN